MTAVCTSSLWPRRCAGCAQTRNAAASLLENWPLRSSGEMAEAAMAEALASNWPEPRSPKPSQVRCRGTEETSVGGWDVCVCVCVVKEMGCVW